MALIVSFKSYYWKDTLAELVYHPPQAGARECWVDTHSQTYAMSYSKQEMQQMLNDGLIIEHMGTPQVTPPKPMIRSTKDITITPESFTDDELAPSHDLTGHDVVITMKEGYVIFGTLVGVDPGGTLIMMEVVVYDGDDPPAPGEAAMVDPQYVSEIREMSPVEQRQWIEDYTEELTDEEVEQIVSMLNKTKNGGKTTNSSKKATGKAKEDKKKLAEIAKVKKEYSTDFVHTDIHPDQLVEKIKIARGKDDCPALTILFHGQPGTSKSQTAKYITNKLGLKIKSYNLGEIMSKWVGGTEKKINEIFEEAKAEGHVILIDEIEGITQDRSGAEKSWQMTHVNAFLQAVDEFDGIVFCTTNFTDSMDKAFLRRFLLKAEFKNLTSEQAMKAAKKFFPKKRFRKPFADDLYAPADFANIKNGFLFMNEEDITVKWITEQLEKEAKSRRIQKKGSSACMDDFARMGFNLKRNK